MTWNERENMKDRLKENLANHIIRRGEVISDRERSNPYVGIRIVIVNWMGYEFMIQQVDGMTCLIEKRNEVA